VSSGLPGGEDPDLPGDEARFQALFDVSPLATVQYGPDGTVELWNPAAERLFGWTAEEARGRRLPERAPGEEARAAEIEAALGRGEALRQVATVLRHRDGSPRPVELSSAPLHDEADRLVGVLVVHAEPAPPGVAWAALVQHSSDVVVVYGPDQRCAYASPSAERVLGWRPAELVGTTLAFPIPVEDQAGVLAAVAATAPGRTSRLTHRFLRPDGTRLWVETVMTDLRADPAVGGLTWHVRDVTEQVQTTQALRAEQERYRSVVQHVGQAVFEIDASGRLATG
jgi:PAS domain S-box-containing protein